MALQTFHLKSLNYAQAGVIEYGTIYFNTTSNAWYSDADCQNQITEIQIPYYPQRKFLAFRNSSSSSTSITYIDETGKIIISSKISGTAEVNLYGYFEQISIHFFFTPSAGVSASVTEFFRSVTPNTQFYYDDQLTRGPLTSIPIPHKSGSAFGGIYSTNATKENPDRVDYNGNITPNLMSGTFANDFDLSSQVRFFACYKLTLNANGGTGGEINPIWYDRVHLNWCADDMMIQPKTTVIKPTKSGSIFAGYYTTSAASGGIMAVDANGNISSTYQLTSANATVYARWASPVTITLNNGSGSGPLSKIYYGGGVFFDNPALENPVTAITTPTLANHRFLGYYSESTQVIDASGNISGTFEPSTDVTITAQYERVSYSVNIYRNGGTGPDAIYANAAKTAVYADEMCSGDQITSVALIRPGFRLLGVFTANDYDSTKLIDGDGTFTAAMSSFVAALSDTATIYAIWQQVFTISLNHDGGTGEPTEIYYDDAFRQFYDSAEMTNPVTRIAIPRKECHTFGGYWTASGGTGTQLIDAVGNISTAWEPTASCEIFAKWTKTSWKFSIDPDGGTGGNAAIYRNGGTSWYSDDTCENAITHIEPPTRSGYTFAGCYSNGDQSTLTIAADGQIIASPAVQQDNLTTKAKWTANTYVLTFDPNGGSCDTLQKQVTFGQPVGELPIATRTRGYFTGWYLNGEPLSPTTVWNVANNARAVASWDLQFGGVTDYFGLASTALIPIASNNGDNKQRICVAHTGRYEPNVDQTSGTWRNPTVTYVVARNTTFNVTLGRAYAGSAGTSGFMIVAATVETRVGQFPTITVEAVANEGANAINLFAVSVPVVARSKAQNLLNSVSGGGYLNACTVRASCEPVVIAENMMPCASDVVHGRLEITATTIATNRENPPTASNGFTSVGEPKQGNEANYTTYTLNAQKEIA